MEEAEREGGAGHPIWRDAATSCEANLGGSAGQKDRFKYARSAAKDGKGTGA